MYILYKDYNYRKIILFLLEFIKICNFKLNRSTIFDNSLVIPYCYISINQGYWVVILMNMGITVGT